MALAYDVPTTVGLVQFVANDESTQPVLRVVPPLTVVDPAVVDRDQDAQLMHRVAAGDLDAFAEFHRRFEMRVIRAIQAVLRDPSQSEEVAQEVFVEAWRLAGQFCASRGRLDSWLVTMARRRAIDRVRSEQSARVRNASAAMLDILPEVDNVEESLLSAVDTDTVRRAMAVLSPVQREAIESAYYGGRTYREAAEHLVVPLSTLKTRIRDGMRRLRIELETSGFTPVQAAC